MIVLDTNAVVYWTLDPHSLTPAAALALDDEDRRLVSSISIWEIGLKAKRGSLKLPLPIEEFVIRLKRVRGVEIMAVDDTTWLRNLDLDWSHRDPADRTIVATADLLGCPLVTSDETIRSFYRNSIW